MADHEMTADNDAIWSAFDSVLDVPDYYKGNDAKTIPQLADHYGLSKHRTRKFVEQAFKAGKMRRVLVVGRDGRDADAYIPMGHEEVTGERQGDEETARRAVCT